MIQIPLSRGMTTVVDDDVPPEIFTHAWQALPRPRPGLVHAYRRIGPKGFRRIEYLHRLILGAVPGVLVDHINGDGLDNRRCNLRFANFAENVRNAPARRGGTSRFKGVCWCKNRWRATIVVDGKQKHLGHYVSEEHAALVYDAAAREFFGEFARLNFGGAAWA